ncbi:hypothetical protein LUZ60_011721 [Juncus effusus]|nr:hypothetical protein LUZ60_011721 [Juncus effusus]
MSLLRTNGLIYRNTLQWRPSSFYVPLKSSVISYRQKSSEISNLFLNSSDKTLKPIYYERGRKNRFKIEEFESEIVAENPSNEDSFIKSGPKKVLVVLNPNSGHGLSSQIFSTKVQPILQRAGFEMEIIETKYAGQAQNISSNINLNLYPDGIICVGGDGIVNEVLNGLYTRNNINNNTNNKVISVPIGIIPTGSDNSLAWTVLGIKDPISAAKAITTGGSTNLDVFVVKWINAGLIHFGLTAAYFGFLSDVLELSEKYRKKFGPLRYFIAGIMKLISLPKYSFELEYQKWDNLTGEDSKENWIKTKGNFLGVLVCNHKCKTVQGLESQIIAPKSVHDDRQLDLLMVRGNGRFRLIVFYIALQFCKHLMLPFVEYVKVKSVKIRAVGKTQKGCGIDGELISENGEIKCSLVPQQLKLLGFHIDKRNE